MDDFLTESVNKVKGNNRMLPKYHPELWSNKVGYGCCRQIDKDAVGCSATYNSHYPHMIKSSSCSSSGSLERNLNPNLNPSPRFTRKSPQADRKSPKQERKSPKSERKSPRLAHQPLYPERRVNGTATASPPQGTLSRKNKPMPDEPPVTDDLISLTSPQASTDQPAFPLRPNSTEPKIVIALFDYDSPNVEDLNFYKGDLLEVLNDEAEPYWWMARHTTNGKEGWIPSNYVKLEKKRESLTDFNWYYPELTRRQAEQILRVDNRDGVFLVRASRKGANDQYVVSILSSEGGKHEKQVKHYHIKTNEKGEFYLAPSSPQKTIPLLIKYHSLNGAGLLQRLRFFPNEEQAPATMGLRPGQKVISESELEFKERLGRGNFGEVWRALYHGKKEVAVKKSLPNMNDQEFIDEATVMMNLQHKHLVRLYGLVEAPQLMIVTEFMQEGALTDYLKKRKGTLPAEDLVNMAIQVSEAMEYLDSQSHIHRDLAARNCLVGANQLVKVADFGLSRHVLDDIYTSTTSRFPIRWVAPEVLRYARFSSKSDVWSFGVLTWEIFTYAEIPYSHLLKNDQVVKYVAANKGILDKPKNCPEHVYLIIKECMAYEEINRPHFTELRKALQESYRRIVDYPG